MAPPAAGPGVGADRWPRALFGEVEEAAAEADDDDDGEEAAVDGVSEEVRPLWVRLGHGGWKRKAEVAEDAEGPLPMARCFQGTTPWKLPKASS
jgi:hypothetical protein